MVIGKRLRYLCFHLVAWTPFNCLVIQQAKSVGRDVVIIDTAGRLAIDEQLMKEVVDIKSETKPENVLFVVDSMIGQDAVKTAVEFDRKLDFVGFVLTSLMETQEVVRPCPLRPLRVSLLSF